MFELWFLYVLKSKGVIATLDYYGMQKWKVSLLRVQIVIHFDETDDAIAVRAFVTDSAVWRTCQIANALSTDVHPCGISRAIPFAI